MSLTGERILHRSSGPSNPHQEDRSHLQSSIYKFTLKSPISKLFEEPNYVGVVQFPFVSDCGAAMDLHVCLCQVAVSCHSSTANGVFISSFSR
ncbi:hypothetical protein V2J09_012502 [Rumex salicifolius]